MVQWEMTRRIGWLAAPLLGLLTATAHAASHPHIDFRPESPRYAADAEAYREIWRIDGARISAALEAATGLDMEPGPIRAIVFNGISSSGYPGWPLRMRADLAPDTKRATLVHELAHRVISPITPRRFDDHPIIFLFVYDVWVRLWGRAFADAQVQVESRRTGRYDYAGAWRRALSLGADGRAERWQQFLAERQRGEAAFQSGPKPAARRASSHSASPAMNTSSHQPTVNARRRPGM
jgi:hypothetical protein